MDVAQRHMRLGYIGLAGECIHEGAFGLDQILLLKVKGPQCHVISGLITIIGLNLLHALQSLFEILGRYHRFTEQNQRLEVLRVPFENGIRLLPALRRFAAQEIKATELQPHLEVFRVEVPRFEQKTKGISRLSQCQVRQPRAFEGVRIAAVELNHVLVFDDRFLILLLRKITVSPFQVFGFFRLRRTGARNRKRQQQSKQDKQ